MKTQPFVFGASISALVAVVISIFVSGMGNLLSYIGYVRETSVKFAALVPVDRMPNLRGLISLLHFRPSVALACVLVLSLAVMALAPRGGRQACATSQFAIAISAATLVGYHVMTHDLSVLLISMGVLMDEDSTRELWIIPVVWLSVVLCFFGHGPFVAVSLLALFLFLALRVHHQLLDSPNSRQFELSEAARG